MADRISFIIFYSVFLVFVMYIAGLAGASIFSIGGSTDISAFPQPTGNWWTDWTLPFVYFWSFFSLSSEFAIIFTLIVIPFVGGMILIIAEMIRGN